MDPASTKTEIPQIPPGTSGPEGERGTHSSNLESQSIRSHSLSDKQNNLFKVINADKEFFVHLYQNKNIPNLNLNRFGIINCPSSGKEKFKQNELISIEKAIFPTAIKYLENAKSTEELIKDRLSGVKSENFLGSVALIDIIATDENKESDDFSIKEDKKNPGYAETHTVCFWKKTKTQFMIIDPSSSDFSKRLEKSIESILPQGLRCNLIEHPEKKFYQPAENTEFSKKSKNAKKSRDCIDIALKIGIVLNEGALFHNNVYLVQNSINLLSNQSAVNPILGSTNNDALIAHLQSARFERRSVVINVISSIPSTFKEFFNYDAWLAFTKLDQKKQSDIFKALEFLIVKDAKGVKDLTSCRNFLGPNKTQKDYEKNFERLEELWPSLEKFANIKAHLQQLGVVGRFSTFLP